MVHVTGSFKGGSFCEAFGSQHPKGEIEFGSYTSRIWRWADDLGGESPRVSDGWRSHREVVLRVNRDPSTARGQTHQRQHLTAEREIRSEGRFTG